MRRVRSQRKVRERLLLEPRAGAVKLEKVRGTTTPER
jgi:hypothetical protein